MSRRVVQAAPAGVTVASAATLLATTGLVDGRIVELTADGSLWRYSTDTECVLPPYAYERNPILLQRIDGDESQLVPDTPTGGVDWQWIQNAGTPEAPTSDGTWISIEAETGEQGLLLFAHGFDYDTTPFDLLLIGEFHLSSLTANAANGSGANVALQDGSENWAWAFHSSTTTELNAINSSATTQPESVGAIDTSSAVGLILRSATMGSDRGGYATEVGAIGPSVASGEDRFTATTLTRCTFQIGNGAANPNDNFGVLKMRNVKLIKIDAS
jgi:hypothetical protein